MRRRVFVSSVVEGFREYREAARQAIESAGMEPILVNEDFPSLSVSSRNACLDAVESSDMLITLVDLRGGWQTPSGKLVIEEEFERARQRKIPVLAFLREGNRDVDADRFAHRLSDYVDGLYREHFESPNDLADKIKVSLASLDAADSRSEISDCRVGELLRHPWKVLHKTTLRIAFVPEREEEIFSPTLIESEPFLHTLLSIGHSLDVSIFSHAFGKQSSVSSESRVIEQRDPESSHRSSEEVRVEIGESGLVVIDTNVVRRVNRAADSILMDQFILAEEDVESGLVKAFRFTNLVYNYFDPYKRHQRFWVNAALSDIGKRKLVRDPKPQSRYTSKLYGIEHTVRATDSPRIISRGDLEQPDSEIARLLSRFRRSVKANESRF